MALKTLQHSLNRDGLLAEDDKDQLRTHPPKSVDTSAESNDLALHFCTASQHAAGEGVLRVEGTDWRNPTL